jgi:hypothetical protein
MFFSSYLIFPHQVYKRNDSLSFHACALIYLSHCITEEGYELELKNMQFLCQFFFY